VIVPFGTDRQFQPLWLADDAGSTGRDGDFLGQASISEELAGIFERLGLSAQRWQHGMEKLRGDRLVGRFFAASRAKLREIVDRIGVRHLVKLTGCPIR
jgi:hypothetical protein